MINYASDPQRDLLLLEEGSAKSVRCCRAQAFSSLSHVLHNSGLMPVVRNYFASRGVIVMFHQIHEDPAVELMTGSKAAFLDYLLEWLRRNDWQIVSLAEALRGLASVKDGRRFAVLTFDDGYRDNMTRALPILERHNAPFTTYVPTGALTRTLYSWWLGLRALFRANDTVTVDAMNRRFQCPNLATKVAGLVEVSRWIHQDLRRKPMLEPTFAAAGISFPAINDFYFLDERELKTLARHPLATIGAHTESHAALSNLDVATVRCEMSDNRAYLERLLELPVQHFAYPYGHGQACGAREAAIAAEVGFSSSVTTRHGQVTSADHDRLQALPRVGVSAVETPARFDARVSGLQRALSDALALVGVRGSTP